MVPTAGPGGRLVYSMISVAVEERFKQQLVRLGAGEVLGIMVEVGVAAVAGLDIGAAHGNQALGFGQGLETADAAVRQHEVEHHVMPYEMADKVNVLGREVQAAQDFAGYAGTTRWCW